jgi:hypothetical protein|tara:strand:- start:6031 stop:6366 length:336 start_codon:yes stop_codon:yes gene_type:complete
LDEIEVLLTEYRELCPTYANAKAQLSHLEDFKKSKLAMCMKKAESHGVKTVSTQERDARCDQEYLDILDALKVAVEEESRLRFLLKRIELEIEIWRTRQADSRMERRAYNA